MLGLVILLGTVVYFLLMCDKIVYTPDSENRETITVGLLKSLLLFIVYQIYDGLSCYPYMVY